MLRGHSINSLLANDGHLPIVAVEKLSRSRWPIRYALLTGVFGMFLSMVAGCGAIERDVSTGAAPNPVPWTQGSGKAFTPTPAGRACGAADLRVKENGNGVWHGQVTDDITLTNSAADACFFQGPPPLQLVSPGKSPIAVRLGGFATQHVDLKSQQEVEMIIGCSSTSAPTATSLVLTAAGGGSVPIDIRLPADCSNPSIVAFQEGPLPTLTGVGTLTVRLNLPAIVTRGKAVNYSVTLSNPATQAISLTPCPSYTQLMNEPIGSNVNITKSTYLLNCQAASIVPAGGSLTFQMIMQVPAGWQPGPAKFLWNLEVEGQPAAGAVVQVK